MFKKILILFVLFCFSTGAMEKLFQNGWESYIERQNISSKVSIADIRSTAITKNCCIVPFTRGKTPEEDNALKGEFVNITTNEGGNEKYDELFRDGRRPKERLENEALWRADNTDASTSLSVFIVNKDGKRVGWISIGPTNEKIGEIAFYIIESHSGMRIPGYIHTFSTTAVMLLIDTVTMLSNRGIFVVKSLSATAHPENKNSWGILEHCGFKANRIASKSSYESSEDEHLRDRASYEVTKTPYGPRWNYGITLEGKEPYTLLSDEKE